MSVADPNGIRREDAFASRGRAIAFHYHLGQGNRGERRLCESQQFLACVQRFVWDKSAQFPKDGHVARTRRRYILAQPARTICGGTKDRMSVFHFTAVWKVRSVPP
jgi:hypothetical protein